MNSILKTILAFFYREEKSPPLNSGDFITNLSDGDNLVNKKQTWEHAEVGKDDIRLMKECCDAEIRSSMKSNFVPAPFYFRRVAILSRKNKDYEQELRYCNLYLKALSKAKGKNVAVQVEALSEWFVKRAHKVEYILSKIEIKN